MEEQKIKEISELSNKLHDFKDDSGTTVTLRTPRGTDIEAACGQLRVAYEKK